MPQTAGGSGIPNRDSVDTQTSAHFMKATWKSPSYWGIWEILFKNEQNKHYGHVEAHPSGFSVILKGKNSFKRWR